MSTRALELRGRARRASAPPQIIRGVDLDVAQGERHAIIGPNGAGKSTLFNLISGCMLPTSGSILLKATRSSRACAPYQINRRGLSRSFQVTNIFPQHVRVGEHALRRAVVAGYRYAFWQHIDSLPDVRERTDADPRARSTSRRGATCRPGVLTYAEQRALEIGITIAGGADVILLDEPTAGMSHAETERAVALIRRLSEGRTLVIVEHDMSVVFGLADRISVLVYGADHRHRHAGGDPRQPEGAGSLSRRGGGTDARGQRPARLLRQEPHPAGRRPARRRRRGRQPARPQRRRPLHHRQGHHGRGAAARLDHVQGPAISPGSCRATRSRISGLGYVPENRDIFPSLTVRQNLMLGMKDTDAGRQAGGSTDMLEMFPQPRGARRYARPACCRAARSRC